MENTNFSNEEESIDIKKIINIYLSNWKWFVLSLVILLLLAFVYIRNSVPMYQTSAKLLVVDDKKSGGAADGLSVFSDLGILNGSSNIQNEIIMLKSRQLIKKMIDTLDLRYIYLEESLLTKYREVKDYSKLPFILSLSGDAIADEKASIAFQVKLTNENNYRISYSIKGDDSDDMKTVNWGDSLLIDNLNTYVSLKKTANFNKNSIGKSYKVNFQSKDRLTSKYINDINVSLVNKDASVLQLQLSGAIPGKSERILDELVRQHDIDKQLDKNEIAKSTSEFINVRMEIISKELSDVDFEDMAFKQKHNLVSVESSAVQSLEKESELEKRALTVSVQLELAKYVNNYLKENTAKYELLPSNLGFEDNSIGSLIARYNELILNRSKMLATSTESNPRVQEFDSQIEQMKSSIINSLKNMSTVAEMELKTITSKMNVYRGQLSKVPAYEKDFRDIARQQQIKETLYLYLLQKREENEIASSANVSNIKVVDYAYTNPVPISPKGKIIYLAAFILGLAIPVGVIYLRMLLNTTVNGPSDIKNTSLVYVGAIPKTDEELKVYEKYDSQSLVAEAFRTLRTNIGFVTDFNKGPRIILGTSTVPNEGKSFVNINLARSFARSGKKVVLMDFDLRLPSLGKTLQIENRVGISNYLSDGSTDIDTLIQKDVLLDNFDVITSGPIPPNPNELLLKDELVQLLEVLKEKYDVIVMDTPPVSLVSDSLLLSKYADVSIYVTRAKVTKKEMLELPIQLSKEGKLKNVVVVLNGLEYTASNNYGYGYEYGYGQQRK